MKLPFRQYHLFQLLETYDESQLPMDVVLHHYFRSHRALGSKDRHFLAETAMNMIRWLGLIDALSEAKDWKSRYQTFESVRDQLLSSDWSQFPDHIQVSFPKKLFQFFLNQYGSEKAKEICLASNQLAPLFIRANTEKISREELLENLQKKGYAVQKTRHSPAGILFNQKISFSQIKEFQQGLFEVQDEGSQLLAFLVEAKPGDHVLDYCSGSGGKTLAFAPQMKGQGQIYLHDIRPKVLQEAKKRMKRAGIQNYQMATLKTLKCKMDWVLVDAPCSGTGTIRRNPDMKWRFSQEQLSNLITLQREIFHEAISYLKPGGTIVYGTCSLLQQENERQVDFFLKTYSLEKVGTTLQTYPSPGGMDGFYGVALKKATR